MPLEARGSQREGKRRYPLRWMGKSAEEIDGKGLALAGQKSVEVDENTADTGRLVNRDS